MRHLRCYCKVSYKNLSVILLNEKRRMDLQKKFGTSVFQDVLWNRRISSKSGAEGPCSLYGLLSTG